jgi:hypothetical protein
VSGEPAFFKRAFGDTPSEFQNILLMPHDFIFNRDWYERHGGRDILDAYLGESAHLTPDERVELLRLLSSCHAREFHSLPGLASSGRLKSLLKYYVPVSKEELSSIWLAQKALRLEMVQPTVGLAEDERVEDAGLNLEDEVASASTDAASSALSGLVA